MRALIRNRLHRLEQLPRWRPPEPDSGWSAQDQRLMATDAIAKALAAQVEQILGDAVHQQPELLEYEDDREQLYRRMALPMLERLGDAVEKLHARLAELKSSAGRHPDG